jgi:hypothetical protein
VAKGNLEHNLVVEGLLDMGTCAFVADVEIAYMGFVALVLG